MNDLETALADALRTAADDDVHVERLLSGARGTGLRYRRRRRLVAAGGAVVSAALLVAGLAVARTVLAGPVAVGPAASPQPAPAKSAPSASPLLTAMPALPPAAAETALAAPAELGRDPLLLHVSLAKLPGPTSAVQFVIGDDGTESIRIDGLEVQVARDTRQLDPLNGTRRDAEVNSRPAVVAHENLGGQGFAAVRWQPAPGLWAQVSGAGDPDPALALANEVRFDRVYRCAVPFRLAGVPAGARVETCNITFFADSVEAMVTVRVATWSVTVGPVPGSVRDANEVLGGRPARVVEHPGDGGKRIMQVAVDLGDHVADLTAEGPYDAGVVRAIAAGYTPAGGTGPADWPVNPLG